MSEEKLVAWLLFGAPVLAMTWTGTVKLCVWLWQGMDRWLR